MWCRSSFISWITSFLGLDIHEGYVIAKEVAGRELLEFSHFVKNIGGEPFKNMCFSLFLSLLVRMLMKVQLRKNLRDDQGLNGVG